MHTTESSLPGRGRLAATSLLILVLSGLFFFSYHDYGLAPFDEGVLMEGIRLQQEGRMDPSRMTHFSVQYLLLASIAPPSGPDLETVRMVWVAVRAATLVLVFLIGIRLLPPGWALLPVVFILALPGPWHKAPVAFGLCLCLHAMLRALDSSRLRDAIWLGGCFVATFALHPYTGFLCALAWGILVVIHPEARFGGAASPHSPSRALVWNGLIGLTLVGGWLLVVFFLWRISPLELLGQNTGLARSMAPGSRIFLAQLRHFASNPGVALTLSIYVALVPILVGALWLVWKRRGPAADPYGRAALMCVTLVGGLNLAKWAVRLDLAHLAQNAAPLWVLFAVIVHRLTAHTTRSGVSATGRSRVLAAVFLIWIWSILVMGYGLTSSDTFVGGIGTRIATDTVPLAHPYGILHVKPEVGHNLAELVSIIQAHSNNGDTLLISALPKILHYLSQRPSPIIAPAFAFPAIFATNPVDEIVDSIRAARTPLVVYSPNPIIPIEDYRLETLAPELHRLINDDYRLLAEVGQIQVRILLDPTTESSSGGAAVPHDIEAPQS